MSHTLGKWEIYDKTSVFAYNKSTHNHFGINIYGGCHCNKCKNEIATQEELEANARLIASAPELLEACKEALNVLEEFGYGTTGEAIKVKQAIAKAEKGE